MENFKKKLIRNSVVLGTLTLLFIAANIALFIFATPKGEEFVVGFVHGVQTGLALVLVIYLVVRIVKFTSAYGSEEKLRKLYIEQNDERMSLIRLHSGSFPLTIAVCVLAGAAVIAAYFNTTVFFTLLGACYFVSLFSSAMKFYYRNKF